MIIPPQSLPEETLLAVLQEFINREGTDYGAEELSLEEKVARLRPQVFSGDVLIVFDDITQSVHLVPKEHYQPPGDDND